MSALDGITSGDLARLKSLKALFRDDSGRLIADLSYSAPKGSDFVVLVLGFVKHGEAHREFALNQLEALGWIPDPELASPTDAGASPIGSRAAQSIQDTPE